MAQLLREGGQALENLQFYTQRKTLVFLFWGLEVIWIVYLFVAASVELFSFCPFEMGIMPHCDRCFSSWFLAWIGICLDGKGQTRLIGCGPRARGLGVLPWAGLALAAASKTRDLTGFTEGCARVARVALNPCSRRFGIGI